MHENQGVGVITFYSSQNAMQGEKVLQKAGFQVKLIPGPKEISPNCGVALQFDYALKEKIEENLKKQNVKYEAIHLYKKNKEKSLLDKFLGR